MESILPIPSASEWLPAARPYVIAGPCAAETETQTVETARRLVATGKVHALRAGIWKPRTRPGQYEGAGEAGLEWLRKAREETGLPVATEVANATHVAACLRGGVDILWIGARTTVNPFSVQEIADSLRGVDIPVFVKNPVNPDLGLWIGALERLHRAGITRLGAIHRGFSVYDKGPLRNPPMWEIAIELKSRAPELPLLCDPSHISGRRESIPLLAQQALDLEMDGLMIESHIDPDTAWSDAQQQLTPESLGALLNGLTIRQRSIPNDGLEDTLNHLRDEIDLIDEAIIQNLSARMRISARIGTYKRKNNVTILQLARWEEIVRTRSSLGNAAGLEEAFVVELLRLIHNESIRLQERIMNDPSGDV